MRIALVGENYYPTLGGIQEHIYHLARQLIGRGHSVRVITGLPCVSSWRGPRDEDWVVRVGLARRYGVMGTTTTLTVSPRTAMRLRRLMRDEKFDLVHVHGPCDMGLPMLLYPFYSGALVGTLHSPLNNPSPLRRLATPYYQWVMSRMDAVISVSEAARAAMARYAEFDSVVVPNGVDSGAFARGRPMAQLRDGRTNILMLGRLEPRNGPDIMIKALPLIAQSRPDVRLVIAGEGRNGTKDYEKQIPAELRDRVLFLGAVFEERADVYASARLCVVPARSGTFSIIILEALAAGLPVVATPFVRGYEAERHFEPVVVARDFTPEALAESVLRALEEEPTERAQRGQAIAREFDWCRVADRIACVYEDVLKRRQQVSGAMPAGLS